MRKTPQERFWSKVRKTPKCWLWTGALNRGYGWFSFEGKSHNAQRVAWFFATGRWPRPYALHTCDKPACVRFNHLFEGDHLMNMQDKQYKGRCNNGMKSKVRCPKGHRYNKVNTIFYRNQRFCRECHRLSCRRRYYAITH